jgi:Tfp pilus assembly protein PilF
MDDLTIKPPVSFFSLTHLWVFLFLLLTVLGVYGQVSDFNFITLDDDLFVSKNEKVLQGISRDNISWAFSFQNHETYWHPVTWLSHMLDVEFFGTDAGWHHISNVFIHLLNAFFLYLLLVKSTGAIWRSFFVAVIFALHPLNVESVAWIAERKNTLSTFFWFLTMLCYIQYVRKPSYFGYMLTLSVFVAGLLAKPMLITLPCVLLLLDYWPLGRFRLEGNIKKISKKWLFFENFQIQKAKLLIVEKIPFLLFALLAVYLTQHSIEKGMLGSWNISFETVPMGARLSNALVSYMNYIGKVLCPINLAIFYPFPDSISLWITSGAFISIVCMTALVIYKSPEKPYLFTGWFWYLGTLVPVLGLVQAGLWPAMADRWAYVPLVGLLIVAVWGGANLIERRKVKLTGVIIGATVFIIILIGISRKQVSYWQNSVTLFEHAHDIGIRNPVIHLKLGEGYAAMNRSHEAIEQYLLALQGYNYQQRNNSFLRKLYSFLGIEMAKINNPQESISYFLKALTIDPDSYADYMNIAHVFSGQNMQPQAINAYNAALKRRPHSVVALNNLGLIYADQKQFNKAVALYKQALDQDKNYKRSYNNLGIALCAQGEIDSAVEKFQKALSIDPFYQVAKTNLNLALSGECKSYMTDLEN